MVTYLTGPVLSLILIVLAGIALRYALWYRAAEGSKDGEELTGLRSETARLKQEVTKLCEQKESLKHALTDHENGHTRVRDEYDQLRREYDVLKDTSRQLELESQTKHEESYLCLRDEYDQLRNEYELLKDTSRQLELESQAKHEESHLRLRDEYDQLRNEYELLKDTSRQLELASQTKHEESYQRLRDENDHLRREYDSLSEASHQLELQSDLQRKSVEHIEETLQSLRDDLAVESQRSHARQTDLDAANATISQLRDEVDLAGDLRLQLDASRENCRELQQALEQSQESIASLEVDARLASALREKQTSLQQALKDNAECVQDLTSERDDFATRLEAALADATQLHDEIAVRKDRIAQLEEQHEDALRQIDQERLERQSAEDGRQQAKEAIAKLEEDLAALHEVHQKLQATFAETQPQLSILNNERESLTSSLLAAEERVAELDAHIGELDAYIGELKEDVSRNEGMARQLRIEKEEVLTRFERERNELGTTILTLRSESDDLRAANDGMAAELEQTKESCRAVEQALDVQRAESTSLVASLRAETDELRDAEELAGAAWEREQRTHRSLERELRDENAKLCEEGKAATADFERERSEREAIESSLRDDIAQLNESIDTVQLAKQAVEDELQRKMDRFMSVESVLRRETEELRQEKESTIAELMDEQRSRQQLEEALRLHAEMLDKLRADSISLEELLARQSAIHASLNQHANQLRVFTGEAHEEISTRTATEQASVDSSATVLMFDDAARNQLTTTDRAPVRDDAALGFVYDTPPAYQDDLKLISGIGEILEKRLNDLGVYTYEQIMNWDQDAIYEFSSRLAFKDRIESEEWVEQARRLRDERYGNAAA